MLFRSVILFCFRSFFFRVSELFLRLFLFRGFSYTVPVPGALSLLMDRRAFSRGTVPCLLLRIFSFFYLPIGLREVRRSRLSDFLRRRVRKKKLYARLLKVGKNRLQKEKNDNTLQYNASFLKIIAFLFVFFKFFLEKRLTKGFSSFIVCAVDPVDPGKRL